MAVARVIAMCCDICSHLSSKTIKCKDDKLASDNKYLYTMNAWPNERLSLKVAIQDKMEEVRRKLTDSVKF